MESPIHQNSMNPHFASCPQGIEAISTPKATILSPTMSKGPHTRRQEPSKTTKTYDPSLCKNVGNYSNKTKPMRTAQNKQWWSYRIGKLFCARIVDFFSFDTTTVTLLILTGAVIRSRVSAFSARPRYATSEHSCYNMQSAHFFAKLSHSCVKLRLCKTKSIGKL